MSSEADGTNRTGNNKAASGKSSQKAAERLTNGQSRSAQISELTVEKPGPRTRRSPLQAFLGTGELSRSDVCKGVYHS